MSTTTADAGAPAQAQAWRDGKRYLWLASNYVPLLPYVSYGIVAHSGLEFWWFFTPLIVFVLIPAIDEIVGDDGGNPPESLVAALQADIYYRIATWLYLPLQYGTLFLGAYAWTTGGLGWVGKLGIAVSVGTANGIGINTAHELGHKREALERWLSKIALAPTFYGHFHVEHNRGHHTRVATPEDPASSKLGESFYRFWPRTVIGSLRSAWALETERHRLRQRSPWTIKNELFNAWLLSIVLFAVLLVAYGPSIWPFLLLQAVVGFSLLEVVNYLEHYGLLRQRTESGRYEKVDPRHSWNSNRLTTNVFLLQLQRHSDHHAYPLRRYHVLRHFDTSPQLPGGYARMIVTALFPPVWRAVMDKRVVAHYGGDVTLANIHPAKREKILARWS